MKDLVIILYALSTVPIEIIFDKAMWREGLNDKPLSTYLRIGSFIILAIIFTFMTHQFAWSWETLRVLVAGGVFAFSVHWLFFDNVMNMTRKGIKWNYQKKGDFMWKLHWIFKILLKLWTAWVSWLFFFHWDWICCMGYPEKLIEYFQF